MGMLNLKDFGYHCVNTGVFSSSVWSAFVDVFFNFTQKNEAKMTF